MTKKQVSEISLVILIIVVLSYALIVGAKAKVYQDENTQQSQEIEQLHEDLKSYSSLTYERDIKIREKDDTIQQLMAQNEGLIWQLQEGVGDYE